MLAVLFIILNVRQTTESKLKIIKWNSLYSFLLLFQSTGRSMVMFNSFNGSKPKQVNSKQQAVKVVILHHQKRRRRIVEKYPVVIKLMKKAKKRAVLNLKTVIQILDLTFVISFQY
jgi:uncharacterized membrane protein